MRYRVIVLVVMFLGLSASFDTQAQERGGFKFKKENRYFGGNLGLSIGTGSAYVDVSPHIGYYITDQFSVGIGGTYKYSKNTINYFNYNTNSISRSTKFKGQYYGGQLFLRYHLPQDLPGILSGLFAHAEFEPLQYTFTREEYDNTGTIVSSGKESLFVTNVFIGGGLMQNFGERASSYVMVLWNLNETYESPYSNPLFRVGFIFR